MKYSTAKYMVCFERSEDGKIWGAWVDELPGLGVCGGSFKEVARLIGEAIPLYVEGLNDGPA